MKYIFDQWTQKLILRLYAFIDILCLKDAIEAEQVLSDLTEADLKVGFKKIGYKN